MGYQWGKSPLGAAGWKARALAAEERVSKYRAELVGLQTELGDARTESKAARREVEKAHHSAEKAHRSAWDAIERLAGKVERLRDRNARNAARVRMLAGDLRHAREALDDARGRIRQQERTVLELRRRLDARADRVEALAGDLRDSRLFFRHLERTLERERAVTRVNIEQLERSLATAQSRAVEAEEKSAPPAPPAPDVVAWEARVRDLEGALRDQQGITEAWRREANDAARAVTMLRGALTTARFNATHTRSEADRALDQTEELNNRHSRKG